LSELHEPHRVVVELTATGHSYGEIGAIIGCPENTVKTRMFHARLQLKRYLDSAVHAVTSGRGTSKRAPATYTEFNSIEGTRPRSGYRL
jgi:hypothetical protein